jgi:hypothetical protein
MHKFKPLFIQQGKEYVPKYTNVWVRTGRQRKWRIWKEEKEKAKVEEKSKLKKKRWRKGKKG